MLRIGPITGCRHSGRWVVTDPHWVRRNHLATIATNHAEPARHGTAVHTADAASLSPRTAQAMHATQVLDAHVYGLDAHVWPAGAWARHDVANRGGADADGIGCRTDDPAHVTGSAAAVARGSPYPAKGRAPTRPTPSSSPASGRARASTASTTGSRPRSRAVARVRAVRRRALVRDVDARPRRGAASSPQAIHERHPRKLLAYNCSPSFNWRKALSDDEIATLPAAAR